MKTEHSGVYSKRANYSIVSFSIVVNAMFIYYGRWDLVGAYILGLGYTLATERLNA